MPAFAYPARIEEAAPGEFIVTFRDVPEAVTGAATLVEAADLAMDALSVAIEGYLEADRPIPVASPVEAGDVAVPLSLAVAARVALQDAMAAGGVSRRALGQRLGKDEKHVRRILAGEASLDQSVAAMRVLGLQPQLAVVQLEAA